MLKATFARECTDQTRKNPEDLSHHQSASKNAVQAKDNLVVLSCVCAVKFIA